MNIIRFLATIAKHIPKTILRLRYLKDRHKILYFNNPGDYYGTILVASWENRKNQLWALLADKCKVRNYIANTIGEKYLIPIYGVYERPDDIDFDKLPNSFVIKTNNSCGTNFFVRDKNSINYESIRKKIKLMLNFPFGELTGQLHYSLIHPLIIIEKYLVEDEASSSITDYKFYCTDGVPKVIMVFTNREKHSFNIEAYDMNWNAQHKYINERYLNHIHREKPECFDEMKDIVQTLASGHKYVRIDLYMIKNKIYFGEITLTPGVHNDAYSKTAMDDLL